MVRLLLPGSLLMKTEEENEIVEVETLWLAEKRKTMEDDKKKTEEETGRLRQELYELQAGFAIQKEELKVEYQKQVDDMFFYGY